MKKGILRIPFTCVSRLREVNEKGILRIPFTCVSRLREVNEKRDFKNSPTCTSRLRYERNYSGLPYFIWATVALPFA